MFGATHRATADIRDNPLEPVDLSSPRAVIEGHMNDVGDAWALIAGAAESGRRDREDIAYLTNIARRVLMRLDLSDVAPTARAEEGYDSATYLWEVLSRIEMPPLEEIPDASAFAPGVPAQWRIPHTDITIARSTEPGATDEFRFSKDTVARAADYYRLVADLPYRMEVPIENPSRLRQILPGWLIPYSVILGLPDGFRKIVLGQAVWKLLALAVMLALFFAIVYLAGRLAKADPEASPARRYMGQLVGPGVLLALLPLAVYLTTEQINIVGDLAQWSKLIADTVGIVAGAWFAWLACLTMAETFIAAPRLNTSTLNAQLLRLTARVAGIVLALAVIFIGANRIGLPLLGVLAGVGVGGLAIALAAQDSLKNLLGSLMIFMDQPYKPGQRIIAETQDGFVEEIGLRSTRIRQMGGSLITIPNEKMARMDIENIGERTFFRRVANLRLPLDTPPEKMDRAIAILEDILKDHEGMKPQLPPRVYFSEINPDSFNIFVTYWYHLPKRWRFFEFNQEINREILRRFAEAGIEFALPSSSMRLVPDGQQSFDPDPGTQRSG
jgi:MscS family membrane protein